MSDNPLKYERREDGIYHLVFYKADNAACDWFLERHEAALLKHGTETPFRMIIDMRPDGMPSVRYLFAKLQQLYQTIPASRVPELYVVYLYKDTTMLSFIRTFLDILRLRAKRRFIEDSDTAEQEAISWLLEQS